MLGGFTKTTDSFSNMFDKFERSGIQLASVQHRLQTLKAMAEVDRANARFEELRLDCYLGRLSFILDGSCSAAYPGAVAIGVLAKVLL